ncbi:hypothetical protein ACS7WQ_08165, partial [Staphylococcus felis]|uniref:hypothetical protein n=1 Tax=Staphylococcus felis TaxID=46127 RepID=UPI003F442FB4
MIVWYNYLIKYIITVEMHLKALITLETSTTVKRTRPQCYIIAKRKTPFKAVSATLKGVFSAHRILYDYVF